MYEQHISDEDVKKFVSAEGPLKGMEWDEFIEFAKEVNGHIRNCPDCLEKVREAQKVYDQEKEEIAENFSEKFKDTIMGKMTKGAILNWGENDENNNWFKPTEEQAEAMVSEGGTKIGEKSFDYSSSEKATNGKTYGSEIAAIKGLADLISKSEGLSQEKQTELIEQMKTEVYTKSSLSPELASRIKYAMEEKGVEASTIEVLGTIHDNWVKDNGNNFDAPKRAKKLYQFTDLRLMTYKDDGAIADLLFLQPILEGAGIELDVQGKLKEEFEKQQKEYMAEHGIADSKGLRNYLKNLGETYPTIEGVTTTKGQKDDKENGIIVPRYIITGELQNPEILERMTEQVSEKIGLNYEKEQTVNDRSKHSTEALDVAASKIAELDKKSEIKESELAPIKKKGFKEWIKGLVDKLMGKGEK